MEVLEVREEIENASTEEEVKILKSQNATRVKDCEKNLGTLLEKGDWENGKKECGRLRYWMGIEEALDNWEPGKPVVLVH